MLTHKLWADAGQCGGGGAGTRGDADSRPRPSGEHTGDIVHRAAGFLYGVSSEGRPTTNTIVPLKSKILVTKGALGNGAPLWRRGWTPLRLSWRAAASRFRYNSNYYGVFGVTATIEQYCDDLKNYICPAVVAWKEAWKEEHGTPRRSKKITLALGSILTRRLFMFRLTKERPTVEIFRTLGMP